MLKDVNVEIGDYESNWNDWILMRRAFDGENLARERERLKLRLMERERRPYSKTIYDGLDQRSKRRAKSIRQHKRGKEERERGRERVT